MVHSGNISCVMKWFTQMYHVHVVQVQTTDQLYILNHFTIYIHRTQVPVYMYCKCTLEHGSTMNIQNIQVYMTLTLHVIHVCPHVPGVYPGTL